MKNRKLLLAIFIILIFNILLAGILHVSISRPLIYYEYIFLPVVLIMASKHIFRVTILIGLILLEFVYHLAHIYYFDVFNYIEKIPSLFTSDFSLIFWIILLLLLFLFIWVCNFFINVFERKLIPFEKHHFITSVLITTLVFCILYFVDSLNGGTILVAKANGKNHLNVGKSLIREVLLDFSLFERGTKQVKELADFTNIKNDSSLSYRYFYNSKGKHEVLILMESWGLLENNLLRNLQLQPFSRLDRTKFKVEFEVSNFYGGTSQAESRELLNKEGEGYYSVMHNNACDIKNLIQRKNEQQYHTIAIQSFPGSYSFGHRFRKLLGFETIKDYTFFHDTLRLPKNFNNHYPSVDDELLFSYMLSNDSSSSKSFTYCLTINTHLPFTLTNEQKSDPAYQKFSETYGYMFPSNETEQAYYRLNLELKCLAQLVNKSNIDRMLIIGDHAPPFLLQKEKNIFSQIHVPAILIERVK